jgi:hypothetical protein
MEKFSGSAPYPSNGLLSLASSCREAASFNHQFQATYLPPLRSGKSAPELGRWASKAKS